MPRCFWRHHQRAAGQGRLYRCEAGGGRGRDDEASAPRDEPSATFRLAVPSGFKCVECPAGGLIFGTESFLNFAVQLPIRSRNFQAAPVIYAHGGRNATRSWIDPPFDPAIGSRSLPKPASNPQPRKLPLACGAFSFGVSASQRPRVSVELASASRESAADCYAATHFIPRSPGPVARVERSDTRDVRRVQRAR